MTTPSEKQNNSSFSSFALGVVFGAAAAFLFGTDEGRKIVRRITDSIPEKYKNMPGSQPVSTKIPILPVEETQHFTTYEAPPPPAPHVRPERPEPLHPPT